MFNVISYSHQSFIFSVEVFPSPTNTLPLCAIIAGCVLAAHGQGANSVQLIFEGSNSHKSFNNDVPSCPNPKYAFPFQVSPIAKPRGVPGKGVPEKGEAGKGEDGNDALEKEGACN